MSSEPSPPALVELAGDALAETLVEPMRDVTHNPHAAVNVDPWPYAEAAFEHHFPGEDTEAWDVQRVLQNGNGTYQHVVIGTRKKPRLTVILRLESETIEGHVVLDDGPGGVLEA